jgi:glycosyltransferase involved in cell wall biosynthesis
MRILFLTQILPYPPDAGPRIKTWNVLRYLTGCGHAVTLLTFLRPEEEPHLPAVQAICEQVISMPIRRSRWVDGLAFLRSLVTRRPFLVERDDLPAMQAALSRLIAAGGFDAVHADQLTMAQFGLRAAAALPAALTFDAHNATWAILDRMRATAPAPLRPLLAFEMRAVRRYEAMLLRRCEHVLAVTDIDRAALLDTLASPEERERAAGKMTTIPIAVDIEAFGPVTTDPGSLNILTLGTLRYPPNAEGIRWFAREVYPLVQQALPGVSLTIIGKDPPADFRQLAETDPSVTVTGYVPDLVPYLERAAVLVVPVLTGSGMRVRILEAFSRALPVVTTTIGLEGIQAEPGQDVLVADTPAAFAAATLRVLQEPALRASLSRHARQVAVRRYSWQSALQPLDRLYPPAAPKEVR